MGDGRWQVKTGEMINERLGGEKREREEEETRGGREGKGRNGKERKKVLAGNGKIEKERWLADGLKGAKRDQTRLA